MDLFHHFIFFVICPYNINVETIVKDKITILLVNISLIIKGSKRGDNIKYHMIRKNSTIYVKH